MNYNLITNLETCYIDIPQLLYYSHIPTAVVAIFIGFFVFWKNKHSLVSKILLFIAIGFVLWSVSDLVIWINPDSRKVMFFWSIINLLEMFVSVLTLYFAYVFLEKKDISFKLKLFFGLLLIVFTIFIPSTFNLIGFNYDNCESMQGSLLNYYYVLEVLFSFWLIAYLIIKIKNSLRGDERKKTIYLSLGLVLFLLSFSGTNIYSSITTQWEILQYGLFGIVVFIGLLAYLIVKFNVFNIKLIGVQALVATLVILIGSQFAFIQNPTNMILNGITLVLSLVFGWFLVKSVKEEIKRKEELQKLSDSLAVTNDRLRELDNAKSEFISIASHQLRTPLTAIKGYTSLLLEGSYGKLASPIQDVLDKVYTINNRLIELVENLLNVSRIEAGRIQYNFEMVWLEPLVKELVDMFAMTAKNRNLLLTLKLPEQMLPKMTIDPNKIKEVVSNLIDNAIKYTKKGGVTVFVEAKEGVARIIIADTGIGIIRDDKVKLFEKFVRSKETASMFVAGSGLGLYIGKCFVEAHGGKIWAESDGMGKGSRFIVELPFLNPNLKIGISEQNSTLGR